MACLPGSAAAAKLSWNAAALVKNFSGDDDLICTLVQLPPQADLLFRGFSEYTQFCSHLDRSCFYLSLDIGPSQDLQEMKEA